MYPARIGVPRARKWEDRSDGRAGGECVFHPGVTDDSRLSACEPLRMARRTSPDLSHIHPELRRFARPIEKLLLDPQNARAHSAENIAAIRESLREHGQVRAAIVTGEEMVLHEGHPAVPAGTVLVGNGMVTAARELGWRTVAAITFEGGAVEARKLALRDNRTAELASWVVPNLVADLRSLQALDVRMPDMGWAEAQLDALIAELPGGGGGDGGAGGGGGEDPGAQPDRAAELQAKWGTQAGQLWEIPSKAVAGKVHRLLCGDSRSPDDVRRLMAGGRGKWCWTDPPYGVDYVGGTGMTIQNDGERELPDLLRAAFASVDLALCEGAPIYVAHPSRGELPVVFGAAFIAAGWHLHETLVWVKDRFVLGRCDYHFRHESILYGWKKGAEHAWYGERDKDTIFDVARPDRNEMHPTMKPPPLVARCIENSSRPGDLGFERD